MTEAQDHRFIKCSDRIGIRTQIRIELPSGYSREDAVNRGVPWLADLREVTPLALAEKLAAEVDKDPRLVELILLESTEVVRHREGVLVVAHRSGIVLANAGIDASNVAGDEHRVLLPPEDCNRSCRDIRAQLAERTGVEAGVLIIDSLGRAWRNGRSQRRTLTPAPATDITTPMLA
jgi:hypothetical protein